MKKTPVISKKELIKIIGASLIGMAIVTWFNYNADLYVFRFSAESAARNISEHLPKIISADNFANPDSPESKASFARFFESASLSGRIGSLNILNANCRIIWSSVSDYFDEPPTECRSENIKSLIRSGTSSDWLADPKDPAHTIVSPLLVTHVPINLSSSEKGLLEVYFAASEINLLWARLRLVKMIFAGAIILTTIAFFYFVFKKRSSEISSKLEAYALIIREAPMGIYTINNNGEIETFNPKMVELAGAKSAEQVVGLNVFDLPSYKEVGLDNYFREGLSGKSFDLETPYISYTGHKKSYRHYLGAPIMSDEGEVEKLILMVEDITLRKELELKLIEEKTRLLASIDSLLLGFLILDAENGVIAANPAFKEISKTGEIVSPEEVFEYWIPGVDFKKEISKATESKEVVELQKISHVGKFFRVIIAPVMPEISEISTTGKVIGSVIVIEDTTEKELLEESKKDFIAITSHEMRTPLSIIRGAAERLLKVCAKINAPDEAHSMATYIDESSIRLLGIVNNLLDVAALEGKSVKFMKDTFDINEVVGTVASELRPKAENKKLSLKISLQAPPVKVVADKDKTREIVSNLMANGIQYTERGEIVVSSEVVGNFVKITFTDTGIGIPPEMRDLIFQKFRSVHSQFMKSREYGSGMGLYIARTIAENMGGKLSLEKSEIGKGSSFALLLPKSPEVTKPTIREPEE